MSRTAKAALWFAFCTFFQQGITLLTTPIFTRLLSTSDYGTVAVYSSWVGILTVFCTLNLSAGVFNNGMIAYEKNRDKYVSAMQGLSLIATAVVFILFLFFKDYWDAIIGLPPALVVLMFIQILMIPPLNFWMVRQRFELKYRKLVLVTVLVAVMTPLLGIILIFLSSDKAFGQILSLVIVQVAAGGFFLVYHFMKNKTFFDKEAWKFALKFNIPLLPHYLALMVLNQVNRILVNNFCGADFAGIYSIAFSAGSMLSVMISAINATLVPWAYEHYKRKDYSALNSVASKLTILMSGCMFLMVVIAPEIVWVLAPAEYYDAVYLIPPIAIGFLFTFVTYLTGTIEFYFGSTISVAISSVFCACLNLLLGIVFIPYFGYESAAYVTLICYMLWSCARYLSMKRTLKKEHISERPFSALKVYFIIVVAAVAGLAMLGLYPYPFYIRYSIVALLLVLAIVFRKQIVRLVRLS